MGIRVLVVDDFDFWRRFPSSTLREEPDFDIVAEASNGLSAVQMAEELQPDLILLDIGLPGLNGIAAASRIREVSKNSKILFLTENRSMEIAREAFRVGGRGYVVKSHSASELLPAVRAILLGEMFASACLGLALHDEDSEHPQIVVRQAHVH